MGLLVQNMNEPKIKLLTELYPESTKQVCNVRPAVAFKLFDRTISTVEMYDALEKTKDDSVDVSRDLRIGVESRITDNFTLRCGAYNFNSITDGLKAYTYGCGYIFSKIPLSIDYCLMNWTAIPDADSYTHQLGVIYKW